MEMQQARSYRNESTGSKQYQGTILQRGRRWYWRFKTPEGKFTQRVIQGAVTRAEAVHLVEQEERERLRCRQLNTRLEYLALVAEVKQLITRCKLPITELPDAFLKTPQPKQRSKQCMEHYRFTLVRFVQYIRSHSSALRLGRDPRVCDITPNIAESFMADCWNSGISESTYNDIKGRMNVVFSLFQPGDSPFSHIPAKIKRSEDRFAFSVSQLRAIWSTLNSPKFQLQNREEMKALYVLALNTGLRCGDLCLLRWEFCDMERKTLSLIPSKTRASSGKRVLLPMNETVWACLDGLRRRAEGGQQQPSPFVLPAVAERYQRTPYGISSDTIRLLEASGIQTKEDASPQSNQRRRRVIRYSFHSFRHTFATMLIDGGTNQATVSKLLGHSSLTMTGRYIHLNQEAASAAVASIERVEGGFPVAGEERTGKRDESVNDENGNTVEG